MMIIGLSTVNVAPATTGSRTPKILPMPTLWIIVAMPDTNRSALTSRPIVDIGSSQRPAHDERHRHGARVHDEQVLESQDEQPGRGQHLVHGMNRQPVPSVGWHGFGRVGQ